MLHDITTAQVPRKWSVAISTCSRLFSPTMASGKTHIQLVSVVAHERTRSFPEHLRSLIALPVSVARFLVLRGILGHGDQAISRRLQLHCSDSLKGGVAVAVTLCLPQQQSHVTFKLCDAPWIIPHPTGSTYDPNSNPLPGTGPSNDGGSSQFVAPLATPIMR